MRGAEVFELEGMGEGEVEKAGVWLLDEGTVAASLMSRSEGELGAAEARKMREREDVRRALVRYMGGWGI